MLGTQSLSGHKDLNQVGPPLVAAIAQQMLTHCKSSATATNMKLMRLNFKVVARACLNLSRALVQHQFQKATSIGLAKGLPAAKAMLEKQQLALNTCVRV